MSRPCVTDLRVALRVYQLPVKVRPHAAAASPPHCLVLVYLNTCTPVPPIGTSKVLK